jgi:hypothetical protein
VAFSEQPLENNSKKQYKKKQENVKTLRLLDQNHANMTWYFIKLRDIAHY